MTDIEYLGPDGELFEGEELPSSRAEVEVPEISTLRCIADAAKARIRARGPKAVVVATVAVIGLGLANAATESPHMPLHPDTNNSTDKD